MPARFECYQAIDKMFREREIQEEQRRNFQNYLKGLEDEIQRLRKDVEKIRATIGGADEDPPQNLAIDGGENDGATKRR